jgi:hypothetical protein
MSVPLAEPPAVAAVTVHAIDRETIRVGMLTVTEVAPLGTTIELRTSVKTVELL